MEKLTNSIANKIASELNMNNDQREVIAYGTFALLQMILSLCIVILFGCLFHVVMEALIISFTISILRKYSGGVHASSPGRCNVIGTIVCIGQALIISHIISPWINISLVLLLGLPAFLWSYYKIYKLAPVDSPAKPIKREEKRKRMRKSSILILCTYLLIVILSIMIYLGIGEKRFLIYSLCIYGGLVWQVFTITESGHLILGKVDAVLKFIY